MAYSANNSIIYGLEEGLISSEKFVSLNTRDAIKNIRSSYANSNELKNLAIKLVKAAIKSEYEENQSPILNSLIEVNDWIIDVKKRNSIQPCEHEIGRVVAMKANLGWQEQLIKLVKEKSETQKITFQERGHEWFVRVLVKEPSARLTYEYSKIYTEFIRENSNLSIDFIVMALSSFNLDNEDNDVLIID